MESSRDDGSDRPAWRVALETLAPLSLAAEWDNVGVIVDGDRDVRTIVVCIDLTEAVLAEVEAVDADLVVAYHPPIFRGIQRLTRDQALGRALLAITRHGRHVYSPHTALDAVADGINDYLVAALGPVSEVRPIEPDPADPTVGQGRIGTLVTPCPWADVAPTIAAYLGLDALQVAGQVDVVRRIAVCPGAGTSVLRGLSSDVDLLLTGEMSHHSVLARVGEGRAVVLTNHTNCERPYLPRFADQLRKALPLVTVHVSTADRDPLAPWISG